LELGTSTVIVTVMSVKSFFLTKCGSMFFLAGDEDEVKEREAKQEFNILCDWMKQQLGDKVAKVQVSNRLSSSPCVLVSGKFG